VSSFTPQYPQVLIRDGMINDTTNIQEYEVEYDYFGMSLSRSISTQKTNVLEYGYFTMYWNMNMITLECNHDYFHDYFKEYPVSNLKATFMESLGVTLFLLLCHYLMF